MLLGSPDGGISADGVDADDVIVEELSGSWSSVAIGFCAGGSDVAFTSGGVDNSDVAVVCSDSRMGSSCGEMGNMEGETAFVSFVVPCDSGVDVIGDLTIGLLVLDEGWGSAGADGMVGLEASSVFEMEVSFNPNFRVEM